MTSTTNSGPHTSPYFPLRSQVFATAGTSSKFHGQRVFTNPASPSLSASAKTSFSSSPIGSPFHMSPEFGPNHDALPSAPVSPFQLPSASLISTFPSSMSIAVNDNSQSPKTAGLVRRISQKGARTARDIIRTRSSITNIRTQMDQSSGPLVRRGRASSKTSSCDTDCDGLSRLDGGDSDSSQQREPRSVITPSSATALSRGSSRKPSMIAEEYPPVIPSSLEAGSQIIKVTRKKRKSVHLKLDPQAAKVTWRSQSKSLYIDDIHDIRRGRISQQATEKLALPPTFDENLCLTIVASDKRSRNKPIKSLFLIFENDNDLTLWTDTLEKLTKYRQDLIAGVAGPSLDEKTLRSRWDLEMDKVYGTTRTPDQEFLNLSGIQHVCHSLHINWSNEEIERKFNEADHDRSGNLDYQQFRAFVKAAKERSEVMKLWLQLKRNTADGIELEPFLMFLAEQQGIEVASSQKFWEGVFHKFVTDDRYNELQVPDAPLVMGFYAFNAFISSSYNSAMSLNSSHARLDRPLNEYFISSSHNTYLLGRQIRGHSSTEGYVKALQEGCRCIEIDCWDRNNVPVVTHGHTKTTWILFQDCVSTIAQFAFEATPYPLILSLEVHCNPANQQRMVEIMEAGFGDMLVKEPLTLSSDQLPSPEELKHKILIKVKTNPEATVPTKPAISKSGTTTVTRRQRSISSPITQSSYEAFPSSPNTGTSSPMGDSLDLPRYTRLSSTAASTTLPDTSSASDDSDEQMNSVTTKNHRSKIISSLASLAVYTRGLKYRGRFLMDTYNHIFSLAENTFDDACKNLDQCIQLEKHNVGHLMRIYPSQMRIRSSNFDPLACWKRGVQMAALNFQTYDESMHLNEAMFSSGSDRTGYVLKPRALRPLDNISDQIQEAFGSRKMTRLEFSIDLISAQYLPRSEKSPMDAPSPYVEVQVYIADDKISGSICGDGGQDAPARESKSCHTHRRRSQIRKHNGYNPNFEGDLFKFSVRTRYPELVFIRWSVWNSSDGKSYNNAPESENNKPDATFTAKLRALQVGYRHLPLRTPSGEQFSFSTLFCKISKGEEFDVLCNDPLPQERIPSLFRRASQRIGFGKRPGSTER
ncbi:MAG: hypothetical protein GOMPHAMPRED_003949 [Gomphillus americanus]|uniref:Phosphoinositide phospholipase C n=1 Tax=Gomphillus americanus TaxID=1940652 RepID=A0A8H3ISC1_9LECA|nr:MAG: hypothetical protein GOMPHAMPRED_003949 [Gomphillus americanus]